MNRTLFRGVVAAMSGAALVGAGVVGTALAAESPPPSQPAALSQLARDLPPHALLRGFAAPKPKPKPRPAVHRATRTMQRPALVGSPRTIAHMLLLRYGWGEGQWSCLDALWARESGWQTYAQNGRSGAYGIPQALPGWKMSTMGSDWRTNPITQIRWGLSYIGRSYGSPCNAYAHSNSYGYY